MSKKSKTPLLFAGSRNDCDEKEQREALEFYGDGCDEVERVLSDEVLNIMIELKENIGCKRRPNDNLSQDWLEFIRQNLAGASEPKRGDTVLGTEPLVQDTYEQQISMGGFNKAKRNPHAFSFGDEEEMFEEDAVKYCGEEDAIFEPDDHLLIW